MIADTQLPSRFRQVISTEVEVYKKGASVQEVSTVPDTIHIPSNKTKEGKTHWLRIPGVICVFVDMRNSTGLSAKKYERSTARAYQLFTETAVRLFHAFEAAYIDVKGDGAFALFDAAQPHRALAAAVTFKTFASEVFTPKIKNDLGVEVGSHVGMDSRTVLVRKIGLRPRDGRTDRQNEVWAGRPVNMAAKLASLSQDGELHVSDRMWRQFRDPRALRSCGCPDGRTTDLWRNADLSSDSRFDFTDAYVLKSNWCQRHGAEYCDDLIAADAG